MLVVDASALVELLVRTGPTGSEVGHRLAREVRIAVPEVADLEVLSALRGLHRGGQLTDAGARMALRELATFPAERVPHRRLLGRCWELRNNLAIYHAAYVATAELLDATLVTCDARIAGAPGVRCPVEVIG